MAVFGINSLDFWGAFFEGFFFLVFRGVFVLLDS